MRGSWEELPNKDSDETSIFWALWPKNMSDVPKAKLSTDSIL
jgi:hypothetical protein